MLFDGMGANITTYLHRIFHMIIIFFLFLSDDYYYLHTFDYVYLIRD